MSSRKNRTLSLVVAATFVMFTAATVFADSEADLSAMPGSSGVITVTIDIEVDLFGSDSDTDSDTVGVTGTALLTLVPTDPSWNHARVETFALDFETISLHFELFCLPFIGCQDLDGTLTDLHLEAVEPFEADVAAGGYVSFVGASFHATGLVHVVGLSGLIDETLVIDDVNEGEFDAHITGAGGLATFDGLSIEANTVEVPPEELPDGVTSLTVVMSTDLSNTAFEGPYVEIIYPGGDINKDRIVDLDDYGLFASCMAGPDQTAVPPACDPAHFTASDFDEDGDVDMSDFSDFQMHLGAW